MLSPFPVKSNDQSRSLVKVSGAQIEAKLIHSGSEALPALNNILLMRRALCWWQRALGASANRVEAGK